MMMLNSLRNEVKHLQEIVSEDPTLPFKQLRCDEGSVTFMVIDKDTGATASINVIFLNPDDYPHSQTFIFTDESHFSKLLQPISSLFENKCHLKNAITKILEVFGHDVSRFPMLFNNDNHHIKVTLLYLNIYFYIFLTF